MGLQDLTDATNDQWDAEPLATSDHKPEMGSREA